ncbi:MAG: hypothetical protein JNN07_20295 [Verrucomicrobiales bacterium]|nr:hypothetical protein [Verrucomicrobiales bacterium]
MKTLTAAGTIPAPTVIPGVVSNAFSVLAACRRPRIRIVLPTSLPALDASRRRYLRELRAAELASWQASGGDYVRASALRAVPSRSA